MNIENLFHQSGSVINNLHYFSSHLDLCVRQLIVGCPVKDNIQMWGATLILAIIWIIAAVFTSPCFIFRTLVHVNFNIPELQFNQTLSYCTEKWPVVGNVGGGVLYSLFSVFVQYLIPIIVLSGAYMRIYYRLKQRIVLSSAPNVNVMNVDERTHNRQLSRDRRMKRTNFLLISIFLIFGISWLPMNIFNFYVDYYEVIMNNEKIYVVYAICHCMGMSSGESIKSWWLFREIWRSIL